MIMMDGLRDGASVTTDTVVQGFSSSSTDLLDEAVRRPRKPRTGCMGRFLGEFFCPKCCPNKPFFSYNIRNAITFTVPADVQDGIGSAIAAFGTQEA